MISSTIPSLRSTPFPPKLWAVASEGYSSVRECIYASSNGLQYRNKVISNVGMRRVPDVKGVFILAK